MSDLPLALSALDDERHAREYAEKSVVRRIRTSVYHNPGIKYKEFRQGLSENSKHLLDYVSGVSSFADSGAYFEYIADETKVEYGL